MKNSGFTLIELTVTMLILGLVWMLGSQLLKQKPHNSIIQSQLQFHFDQARYLAVSQHQPIFLCISFDGITCHRKGNRFILIHADSESPSKPDASKINIKTSLSNDELTHDARWEYWRFEPSAYLTRWGTWVVCRAPQAQRYIVNRWGRWRIEHQTSC